MAKTTKLFLIFIGICILIGGYFLEDSLVKKYKPIFPLPTPTPENTRVGQLPGLQTEKIPWIPEINHLKERLNLIGLPVLTVEGTVLHTHQHLDIYINGKQTEIPGGIGINEVAGFVSPIHTHDTTGIIHVESPISVHLL